jgi:hypothetical protein
MMLAVGLEEVFKLSWNPYLNEKLYNGHRGGNLAPLKELLSQNF